MQRLSTKSLLPRLYVVEGRCASLMATYTICTLKKHLNLKKTHKAFPDNSYSKNKTETSKRLSRIELKKNIYRKIRQTLKNIWHYADSGQNYLRQFAKNDNCHTNAEIKINIHKNRPRCKGRKIFGALRLVANLISQIGRTQTAAITRIYYLSLAFAYPSTWH